MSLYNFKYRPQKISELGLKAVREGLARVFKSGKVPHAFLFAGPRGTGKTSAARIVAKVVNCERSAYGLLPIAERKDKETISHKPKAISQFEPCNECAQCLSITIGNNLDILEIDAASNRGIDDIRDLREKVKLAPSAAAYKVYIIDEAHMLTPEAFNALLKTLEEPPKHVIFILSTTEPEKLPETIISRCLRFNFKKAKTEEILEKLSRVASQEKLTLAPEALQEIANGAGGSFRDGLKILEQASFAEEVITKEQVKEILGQTAGLVPENLLKLMLARDTKGALEEVARVISLGANLRIYTQQLLEFLRGLLLAKVGVSEGEDGNTEDTEGLMKVLNVEDIRALIEIFSRAALALKEAVIPQLPLELAVVEWCGGESQKLVENHGVGEEGDRIDQVSPQEAEERPTDPTKPQTRTVRVDQPISFEEIANRWQELLQGVRPRNYSIEAFLRASRPHELKGQVLTVEVFYEFHKDKLESDKCRTIVEAVAREIFGTPLLLKFTLGQKPAIVQKKQEEESEEIPANGETEDEDILKVAEEIFNGKTS